MKYMAFNDSEILREFGRLMEEKDGLTKIAQAAQPDLAKLQKDIAESPNNQYALQRALQVLHPLKDDAKWAPTFAALDQRRVAQEAGKDAHEVNAIAVPLPALDGMASQPPAAPSSAPIAAQPAAPSKDASVVEVYEKTADAKSYDVTGKEDIVDEAHPKPAKVCGDELVENLNEQQDADEAVATKSAKEVLVALYKLAQRLKAEDNEEAFDLVKKTFLDISGSLKK